MPPTRAISAAVLLSTAALLSCSVAACAPPARDGSRPGGGGTAAAGQDENRFWKQSLDWKDCPAPSAAQGGGEAPIPLPDGTPWQCATMQAPLDWNKPAGESIGIELIRARSSGATDDRIGSLLLNFGGPGVSGVSYLPFFAPEYEKLRSRYDLVSFDPRGAGDSRGVRCLDLATTVQLADAVDLAPDDGGEEADTLVEFHRKTAAACEKNSGDVLPHVRTTEAARDLDLMRHVLGDEKLHYFGISYGTQLGGVYAHLFPEHVGRAVLDGVIDPTQDLTEQFLGAAGGFQLAFEHFAAWCIEQGCTLGDSVEEIVDAVVEREAELDDAPLLYPDGTEFNSDLFVYTIAQTLYSQSGWPGLLAALEDLMGQNAAATGNGALMLDLAESLRRHPFGGGVDDHSNQTEALRAITCADYNGRSTVAEVEERLPEFLEASPVFGRTAAWGTLLCEGWPVPGEAEHPEVSAPGAPPILLVGNTGDPATPYEGTARMAEQLGEGVAHQLTYRGEGHASYSASACVRNAVDAYLLSGTLPGSGAVCEAEPLLEGK